MKQHKHQSIINRPREQPHIDIFIPQNFSGCQNGNGKGWNARHQILRHQCGKGCGQQYSSIIAKLPQHMHDTAIVQHRFKNRTENQHKYKVEYLMLGIHTENCMGKCPQGNVVILDSGKKLRIMPNAKKTHIVMPNVRIQVEGTVFCRQQVTVFGIFKSRFAIKIGTPNRTIFRKIIVSKTRLLEPYNTLSWSE